MPTFATIGNGKTFFFMSEVVYFENPVPYEDLLLAFRTVSQENQKLKKVLKELISVKEDKVFAYNGFVVSFENETIRIVRPAGFVANLFSDIEIILSIPKPEDYV